MKFKMLFAAIVFAVAVSSTHANVTAGDLAGDCKATVKVIRNPEALKTLTPAEALDDGLCVGYVKGFMDGVDGMLGANEDGSFNQFAFVKGTTPGQVIEAFFSLMEAYPEQAKEDPSVMVFLAAVKAKLATVTKVHVAPKAMEQ